MPRIVDTLVCCLIFFTICNEVRAQVQLHGGLVSSYNTTFVLDNGLLKDPRYKGVVTYNSAPVGINLGIDFSKTFGLSAEAVYSHQGQVYHLLDVMNSVKGKRSITLTYFNIPLLLRFMSNGNGATRGNFSIGPQVSLLRKGQEELTAAAGTYTTPNGIYFENIRQEFPDAKNNNNNTYTVANDQTPQKILTSEADQFRTTELQVVVAFGLDIDLSRHLFLSTQLRGNYSFTDMRSSSVIKKLKDGETADLYGTRANLLAGIQLGVHYMFGSTRSFRFKR